MARKMMKKAEVEQSMDIWTQMYIDDYRKNGQVNSYIEGHIMAFGEVLGMDDEILSRLLQSLKDEIDARRER